MTNHSAKFALAIFATILAGTSFAAVPESGAKTADNCLSGPRGTTPAGHHWYYRFDRATKRQCWYSREERETAGRATPQDLSPPSKTAPPSAAASNPVPPLQSPTVSKSVADARAELRVEPATGVNAEPQAGGVTPASIQNSPRAIAPDALAPPSPVASRWPDASGAISPSGNPRLAAAEPPASPPADVAPAPQRATAPVALAAADASLEKRSASMQMLLLVMAGALALAGVTANLIFRFSARPTLPDTRSDRHAIWDRVRPERPSPSMFPDDDMPVRRANVPRDVSRDPRAPDDPERRVTEMLARLARSGQT
jgi:hypothetical protein